MEPPQRHFVEPEPGARLAYTQSGSGPDIVLLHGTLVTLEDMVLGLGGALEGRARVTAFDRPGHGASPAGPLTGSPWRQARAISAALETLGVERPVLVGHSYGGAVALALALQDPDRVAGVVALAPIVFPELRLEHLVFAPRAVPVFGGLVNFIDRMVLDPALLPLLRRSMFLPQEPSEEWLESVSLARTGSASSLTVEGQDAVLLNFGLAMSTLSYTSVKPPVRIFAGTRDMVVDPRRHSEVLAGLLPDGSLRRLQGLGHMVHHFAADEIAGAALELAGRGTATAVPAGAAPSTGSPVPPAPHAGPSSTPTA